MAWASHGMLMDRRAHEARAVYAKPRLVTNLSTKHDQGKSVGRQTSRENGWRDQ